MRSSSREDSPIDIELPQHVLYSPGPRSATPGNGSPAPPEDASQAVDLDMSSQAYRRSPSDLERLSPVSQLLLCSRPGLLHRHLAVPRVERAQPPLEAGLVRDLDAHADAHAAEPCAEATRPLSQATVEVPPTAAAVAAAAAAVSTSTR